VLGKHIRQSGSLVSDERLRFDFTHPHRIENHDLDRIEELVNDAIMKNLPVNTSQTALTKAKDMGAMALFGEKYGDTVRMISVGTDDSRFSLELCGGTHCKSTGEIGFVKVTGENGIASGIRRIEAVTGKNAWRYVKDQEEKLGEIEGLLKVPLSNVTERVSGLIQSNKELAKQASALKIGGSKETEDDLIKKTRTVNGIKIISAEMNGMDRNSMRMFADRLKDRLRSGIIILGSIIDGKPAFITMVTKDLVEKGYRADNIVKHIAVVTGGTGGGRADMAQAGGREVSKMEKALAEAEKIIQGSKDDIYP